MDQSSATEISQSLEDSARLMSINNADLKSLITLPGIGEARAQAIIDARPYTKLDELVSRKIISQTVFNNIKELIGL